MNNDNKTWTREQVKEFREYFKKGLGDCRVRIFDNHDKWRFLNGPVDGHTIETCTSKFNNLSRFEGFPKILDSTNEESE